MGQAYGQNRVTEQLEAFGDECGADSPCGITAAKGQQRTPVAGRYRWRRAKVACQIPDVFQVVLVAEPAFRVVNKLADIVVTESDRATDTGMGVAVKREWEWANAFLKIRLDQNMWLAIVCGAKTCIRPQVQSGMRPG